MENYNDLTTIIIIPASLRTAARNAVKKYNLDPGNEDTWFGGKLYPIGSTTWTTPTAYIVGVHLPIWKRIKLESIVSGLNNANVWVEDVDMTNHPDRLTQVINSLNLMRRNS